MRLVPTSTPPDARGRPGFAIALGVVVWLAVVVAGLGALVRYANTNGAVASAPNEWPVASRLARAAPLPTLVMLVHPRCSCSRASLGELAEITTRASGRVTVHVLFVTPEETPEGWAPTDLWRRASSIAGVR